MDLPKSPLIAEAVEEVLGSARSGVIPVLVRVGAGDRGEDG